jgi:hypothetical protein
MALGFGHVRIFYWLADLPIDWYLQSARYDTEATPTQQERTPAMGLTLVVLAAGKASRFGRMKQLEPVGPHGAALMDYAIYDGRRAGFENIVLVVAPGLASRFQAHVADVFRGRVSVTYVEQELAAVPDRFPAPSARTKPWGTAHALLAATGELDGPFAVINADDFYGGTSYGLLSRVLGADMATAALVGFPLASTLSTHGGVSRGICTVNESGFLTRLVEVMHIEERDGRIGGTLVSGTSLQLTGHEIASMNMWGLTPAVLDALHHQFAEFLRHEGADPGAEFLLSTAVGQQVAKGHTRLRVLQSHERWFGMTYADDTPVVAARIAELIANGEYPEHLWKELP